MRNYYIFLFLLFVCGMSFSQNKIIDSLKLSLKNSSKDTNKVINLNVLSRQYYSQGEYQTALWCAEKAYELSDKLQFKKGKAAAFKNIGNIYSDQANLTEALNYYFKSLKLNEEINDKLEIAKCNNNISGIYKAQNQYQKALDYLFKTMATMEQLKDSSNLARCYNNIGDIYIYFHASIEAYKYFTLGLKINEKLNNPYELSLSYLNIGQYFYELKNYKEALNYFFKSLALRRTNGDVQGMAVCYAFLGQVYFYSNNYVISTAYSDSCLQLSKEIGDLHYQSQSYALLSQTNEYLGKYKDAYLYGKLYKKYSDRIFNEENSRELGDMKTQFEVDKKAAELKIKAEAQQSLADEEKKRQRFVIYSVAGLLGLVMIFAGFMVNRFRVTNKQKKIIELKEQETQKQNEIISYQKHLVEEKHTEITDSINYAERIQRALLASNTLLNSNLSSLRGTTCPEFISGKQSQSMSEIVALPLVARNHGADYFVFFQPKDVVSGDFYWASELSSPGGGAEGGGRFCLVTADSTGHGVPGAIMSMLNMNSLKEAITKGLTAADDILNYTRSIVINTLANDGSKEGGKDGMDCSLLIFDFKNMTLDWVAANNPVWIVRQASSSSDGAASTAPFSFGEGRGDEAEVIELKPQKMPVGRHERQNEPFVKQTFQLQKNDVIYAITDGYPDQFGGEKGKKFMSKNLKELLKNNSHLSMPEQKNILEQTFKDWVGDLEQVDDVTIIGVRV